MADSFEQLVASASRGDRTAVEELLVRHLPGLRAFIRLRAGPLVRAQESASDLAQSVCREVLLNLSTFRYGGEAGFRRWLFTTALRTLQKKDEHWRAQKREAARVQRDETALLEQYRSFSSPSNRAVAREELERIEGAFDELDEDEREVITLARVVGLAHKEIAEVMGRSEGATRVLLHRSLAHLAEVLDRPH